MKIKLILIFVALISAFHLNAQKAVEGSGKPDIQEFEFKDVTKEELEQKYHPRDSSASAAILYEKGKVEFVYQRGWKYEREVTRRIKIYTKDGYDQANISIPYLYPDETGSREDINKIKARTYNLKEGKVEDERVRNRDIIDEEKTENVKVVKFTFPKVEPGSVLEYTYTLSSPLINNLREWRFQHSIPTDQSVYKMSIPEPFGYSERNNGYHQVHKEKDQHRQFMKTGSTAGNVKLLFNDFNYYAVNIPKMKNEPFVNNQSNYLTSIKHELSLYKNLSTGHVKSLTLSWKDIIKGFYESEYIGGQLESKDYFKEDVDNILDKYTKDGSKVYALFNLVRSRVIWNENSSMYCSETLDEVYEEGKGNSADINIMLISMLRYAGFNANPILVSTIDHGVPNTYPSRSNYNYLIAGVELGDGKVLKLDATSRFTKPDQLPYRCLNWNGRLIRRNGTHKKIFLNPYKPSKMNYNLNLEITDEGLLKGNVRKQFTEQFAYLYRSALNNIDEEEYIKEMENEQDIEVTNYDKKNLDSLNDPVLESFSFLKENGFDKINDKIYISPLTFLATDENPFKQGRDERKFPINFTHPRSKKIMINFNIPEGFKVEYIPEKAAFVLPKRSGSFKYHIQPSPNGDKIQIFVQQVIKKPIFQPSFYPILKQFYDKIVQQETDKIVLTRT